MNAKALELCEFLLFLCAQWSLLLRILLRILKSVKCVVWARRVVGGPKEPAGAVSSPQPIGQLMFLEFSNRLLKRRIDNEHVVTFSPVTLPTTKPHLYEESNWEREWQLFWSGPFLLPSLSLSLSLFHMSCLSSFMCQVLRETFCIPFKSFDYVNR